MKIDKNFKSLALQAAGVTAGEVAATFSNNLLDKIPVVGTNAYAKAGVKVLGGLLLANKMGKKNKMVEGIGVGIAVSGLRGALNEVSPGLISGVVPSLGAFPGYIIDEPKMSGQNYGSLGGVEPTLGGATA